jgi:hypothetical protein
MRDRGCHVIQAEGDANVEIVKAAVATSSYKTTCLIREDMDLLVLLLHHASSNGKKIYFRLDEGGPTTVLDIKVIKQVLGNDICSNLLFLHAFMGCDTTSQIFGIGKSLSYKSLLKMKRP